VRMPKRLFVRLAIVLCLLIASFFLVASASAQTEILSVSSGQCVQPSGGSTGTGALMVQEPCAGAVVEEWTFTPIGSYYHVVSQNSGLCLNVPGNSKQQGTQLIQWTCQSSSQYNDQWTISAEGNYFHLLSRSSGQCVNISGNSLAAGAGVIQWPCQSASQLNDQFYIDVSGISPLTLPSTWSPVTPLAVNPIAVANMPNGNVLMWSAYEQFSYEGDIGNAAGQTYTGIFNPATYASSQTVVTSPPADMFCPGTALLPNGNVLVNGGSSSPKTSIFNPVTNAWSADAEMNIPRGYEGDTLLSTGSVFTFGGSWSGGLGGKNAEVWTEGGGWAELTGVPETNVVGPDPQGVYRGDNHLWLFAQSGGSVFQAGPSAQMNWITTSGAGTIQSAGDRGNDPYSINGNAVLYDIGKILKVGGAPAYQQDGNSTIYATNSAYQINISAGPNSPVQVTQLTGMTYPRAFSSGVVLPSGSVVVVGGQSIPQPFTDTAAVLTPEIWNPSTQMFSLLNPMQTPRTYHSTALLLPDGRVFVGGGGQCGTGCVENHLNAEILTPPYLLNSNGTPATRPVIQQAPTSAALGSSITVTTNSTVTSFVLMRLSSITHTVNNDQRRVPLTIGSSNGYSYTMTVPSDPGVVLPGYYMLFALNSQGVPSVSTTIQIP